MFVKLWFSVNIYNSPLWGFGERGVGRHRFSIIITTFVDGRYPIPRSEPRAGGLLFYYTKIRFNTTIYDVCPIEQGQE